MTKDKALEILDEFYKAMKNAELLAYESCNKRDAEQEDITNIYADIIVKLKSKRIGIEGQKE